MEEGYDLIAFGFQTLVNETTVQGREGVLCKEETENIC
jgi:hypothetical protein